MQKANKKRMYYEKTFKKAVGIWKGIMLTNIVQNVTFSLFFQTAVLLTFCWGNRIKGQFMKITEIFQPPYKLTLLWNKLCQSWMMSVVVVVVTGCEVIVKKTHLPALMSNPTCPAVTYFRMCALRHCSSQQAPQITSALHQLCCRSVLGHI